LGAEAAGLFGIAGAVGILFAPIAGKIGDRRGPADLIVAGAFIMLASWLTFAAFGTVAGLIVGVILLDFGEQAALVSNQQVIYALRPDARVAIALAHAGSAAGLKARMFSYTRNAVCPFGCDLEDSTAKSDRPIAPIENGPPSWSRRVD
jgi:MFS family permease